LSFKDTLLRQLSRKFQNATIWISHKPPDAYPIFPYSGIIEHENEPKYIVGRSMYESTGIPSNWKTPANDRADEIWVPSKFLVDAFVNSGILASKIKWMPEPIDTDFYNPETVEPLQIKGLSGYNFISVFKWEPRKGPDFLLRAFFSEFKKHENVTLYLLTYEYGGYSPHSKSSIERLIRLVAMKYKFDLKKLPKYKVINQVISSSLMPSLYKTFDAFVLPTRGEGWGLPFMEAMT
jgi:glycosyltransferase involved in cell wall biosynthesis